MQHAGNGVKHDVCVRLFVLFEANIYIFLYFIFYIYFRLYLCLPVLAELFARARAYAVRSRSV